LWSSAAFVGANRFAAGGVAASDASGFLPIGDMLAMVAVEIGGFGVIHGGISGVDAILISGNS